ncbi:nuclear transport factor 2 family protein [Fulvivirga ligni]|uniref:nuclear transport factor 2 family protein n=1 Tax=Fulvivirga ligni TaxID=2904246 RepID=UPI001F3891D5|nr:nuclear transport factor 2 family protein [Fulvivirga ligni]UII21680.1 nuclear transport factor 2 family protein [Fulvivirga ligni]
MKKTCFYFLFIFLIMACESTAQNSQIVKKLYEAFNNHNITAMAECYADSALMLDPLRGTEPVWMTRKAIFDYYSELHQQFPDVQDEVKTFIVSGDQVVVEFVASAKGEDGNKWYLPICTVFTLKNGEIVKDASYYDQ